MACSGVGMSGTHQNLKILGTTWYRVPGKFQKLGTDGYWPEKLIRVPIGTGSRPNFQRCRALGLIIKCEILIFGGTAFDQRAMPSFILLS